MCLARKNVMHGYEKSAEGSSISCTGFRPVARRILAKKLPAVVAAAAQDQGTPPLLTRDRMHGGGVCESRAALPRKPLLVTSGPNNKLQAGVEPRVAELALKGKEQDLL